MTRSTPPRSAAERGPGTMSMRERLAGALQEAANLPEYNLSQRMMTVHGGPLDSSYLDAADMILGTRYFDAGWAEVAALPVDYTCPGCGHHTSYTEYELHAMSKWSRQGWHTIECWRVWVADPERDCACAEIEARQRVAARVTACSDHDCDGAPDGWSGLPTCSKCNAILTDHPVEHPV